MPTKPTIKSTEFLILGAGPAGLTAAAELVKRGRKPLILEKDPRYVGGISRTEQHQGFRFDIGGHRFFSKSAEVTQWWQDALGSELIERPRSSMIYFNGKFFSYPLKAGEALLKVGVIKSVICVLDYARVKVFPRRPVVSFEDWVVNNFGRSLFEMFFKTYTEKVWGIGCDEISADWAAQRIKGFNLWQAIIASIKNSLGLTKRGDTKIKTIINSFLYPKYGPGQMWETVAGRVTKQGGTLWMASEPTAITKQADGRYKVRVASRDKKGTTSTTEVVAQHIISSIPLSHLALFLYATPSASKSKAVVAAAKSLQYRDFITVAIFLEGGKLFSDNWIYIHDPSVHVGRVQNYKSWSPYMVPDASKDCLGLEYFCNAGDKFWGMADEALIALAKKEILQLGLVKNAESIKGGYVVRQERAYPVYAGDYKEAVEVIRTEFAKTHPHVHCVGRNGMHKYNNQDHAMMTAILTVANVCEGRNFDTWGVNEDAEYHEEVTTDRKHAQESLITPPMPVDVAS